MHLLTLYKQTLEQRNNYLKQIKFENKPENMLDIWDEKLVDYGIKIYEYRNEFIEKIQKKIKNIHFNITQEKENIEIKYFSDASTRQNFINELKSKRKLDIIKGFTTKGAHRDDFNIYINDGTNIIPPPVEKKPHINPANNPIITFFNIFNPLYFF